MKLRCAIAICALLAALLSDANAGEKSIKIGVLNDETGMAADLAGPGSVVAARLAVEDFGPTVLGRPIEVVVADHQNKPDIAASIARRWYDDEGVDAIVDLANSSTALAVFSVADEKKKIVISTSGISSLLTGERCIATGFQWTTDTYSLTHAGAAAVVKSGGDSWFFITADYAFGRSLDKEASSVVEQAGGKVVGRVYHPFGASDFSSYILAAQSSEAKVVALANGAGDLINSVKEASKFGLTTSGKKLVAFLVYISDVHAIGLEIAQNTLLVAPFYWDQNEKTQDWTKRFMQRHPRAPTFAQASTYSAVLHYLKAVKATGTEDGPTVAAAMTTMKVDDFFTRDGVVRPDHRLVRDHYFYRVKSPSESKYRFDYYQQLSKIDGDTLVKPISESDCPLVKK